MNKSEKNPVEIYTGVSHTQLSIARYFGGTTINGTEYKYFPKEDTLVRKDKVKEYKAKLIQKDIDND